MIGIIDHGQKDFIRMENGKPFLFLTYKEAEQWLESEGTMYGWTEEYTFMYDFNSAQ